MTGSGSLAFGVNIYPSYNKTFDLIFARAKNEEWRPVGDLNPRRRRERAVS
jgi:hypothetical protein